MAAAYESAAGRNGRERARIFLEDAGEPVIAEVRHRGARRMTVERPLPFLRLDGAVRDEAGRRGRIGAVRVAVEDGTPRIVLDLVYEETARAGLEVLAAPRVGSAAGLADPPFRPARLVVESTGGVRTDPTLLMWGADRGDEPKVIVEPTRPPRPDHETAILFRTGPEQRLRSVVVDDAAGHGQARALVPRRAGPPGGLRSFVALAARLLRGVAAGISLLASRLAPSS